MGRNAMKKRFCLTIIMSVFFALWAAAYALPLPEGVTVEENFRPGLGESLGLVQQMQGSVFVIHEDLPGTAFRVIKGIPVFKGDAVITGEDGKVSMELTDGSLVTLTTLSNAVISEHIFDEKDAKERASFLSLHLGKARFFVKKLFGFERSEFKVKTKTAIVGVRGSDFVVEAEETSTEVTALENTRLEVVSLIAPCTGQQERKHPEECEVKPMVLTDFRQAVITADGQIAVLPDRLAPEQADRIRQEFLIRGDGEEYRKDRYEDGFGRGTLVSDDKLVPPEQVAEIRSPDADRPEIIRRISESGDAYTMSWHDADEIRNEIVQDIGHDRTDHDLEDVFHNEIQNLPGFPGSPE